MIAARSDGVGFTHFNRTCGRQQMRGFQQNKGVCTAQVTAEEVHTVAVLRVLPSHTLGCKVPGDGWQLPTDMAAGI